MMWSSDEREDSFLSPNKNVRSSAKKVLVDYPAKKAALSSPAKKAALSSPAKKVLASPTKKEFASPAKKSLQSLLVPSSNPTSPSKYDTDAEIGSLAKSVSRSLSQDSSHDSDSDASLDDIVPQTPQKKRGFLAPNSPIISPQRGKASPKKATVKCSQAVLDVVRYQSKDDENMEWNDAETASQMSFHPGRDTYDVISAGKSRDLCAEDLEDAEIWLVQAPSSMNIEKLSSASLDFEGQQVLDNRVKGGPDTMRISYTTSNSSIGSMSTVLPSRERKRWHFVSEPFAGKMTITQEYRVPEPTYHPARSPSFDLPSGLKVRYVPFGCGRVDDVITSRQDQGEDMGESEPKRKKKKKSDRSLPEAEVMDQSSADTTLDISQESISPLDDKTSKKKKKKKKYEMDDIAADSSLNLTQESVDISVDSQGSKKKKRKKETNDTLDESSLNLSQSLDASVEDQRAKKKKKKKKHEVDDEAAESSVNLSQESVDIVDDGLKKRKKKKKDKDKDV